VAELETALAGLYRSAVAPDPDDPTVSHCRFCGACVADERETYPHHPECKVGRLVAILAGEPLSKGASDD